MANPSSSLHQAQLPYLKTHNAQREHERKRKTQTRNGEGEKSWKFIIRLNKTKRKKKTETTRAKRKGENEREDAEAGSKKRLVRRTYVMVGGINHEGTHGKEEIDKLSWIEEGKEIN